MTKLRRHEFEDQTLTDFSLDSKNITLKIKCWNEDADRTTQELVVFTNIDNLEIDSVSASDIEMLSKDGEIIHFEVSNHRVLLIIIWHDNAREMQITKSYKFSYSDERTS